MKKIMKKAQKITTLGVIAVNLTSLGVQATQGNISNFVNDDTLKNLEASSNSNDQLNTDFLSDINSTKAETTGAAATIDNNISDHVNPSVTENNKNTVEDAVAITDILNQEVTTGPAVVIDNPSPLVITEVLPDSDNINGSDAYEFIEIYNNSNEAINLSDYKIYYNYPDDGPSSDVMWASVPFNVEIGSGKTLVFWIKNGANDSLTVEDFNKAFKTNLVKDKDIVEINSAGMANGSARGIKLTTNTKEVLDYVTYNMSGAKDVKANKSIKYKYDMSTGKSKMTPNSTPTPGSVDDNEKPDSAVDLGDYANGPSLEDMSDKEFSSDRELNLSVKAEKGDRTVKTVNLYIKDNTMSDYEVYNLTDGEDGVFTKKMPALDIANKASYTYYFEASDGTNTKTTAEKTINNTSINTNGFGLNVSNNQEVSGEKQIIVAGNGNKNLKLSIDGEDVTDKTTESLGQTAKIAFDVSQTDVFFKNAVAVGDDLIGVFDDGTYSNWATIQYDIPVKYFEKGKDITISIHAGNKANALEHNSENNDDFILKNLRLLLPNGQTLRASECKGENIDYKTNGSLSPDKYQDPDKIINMGDSSGTIEILNATFKVDDDAYTAIRYNWNTKDSADGSHNILATSGDKITTSAQVVVDNTAPEITTNMEDKEYKGEFTIEASATDATTEVLSFSATLDGKDVQLPLKTSSASLLAGNHVLKITAKDAAGNESEKVVNFTIPQENPNDPQLISDGTNKKPTLSIKVTDPTNDAMDVTFKTGDRYDLGDAEVKEVSGMAQVSGGTQDASDGYPYRTYDVAIKDDVIDSDLVGIDWEGQADPDSKVNLYAYSVTNKKWNLIKGVTTGGIGNVQIKADVPVGEYRNGNSIKVMIQNGIGYNPTNYAPGTPANPTDNTEIKTYNKDEVNRDDYDFTFALESDTQYYNENKDGHEYHHQVNIHDWILANRPRMNIQYMFHTGDIVDNSSQDNQWANADKAYDIIDNEHLPYGVLAGNHDVGHKSEDYTEYGQHFGADRYDNNPWYGESYKNNRGHYDLITVDGIDFIMIYMGWGIGDDEIKWLNEVLAKYPERKAILNFHEYLLSSKGLGEEPQRIYNEVVSKNKNVCMVLSGHYHSAATRVDKFDDDGDGVPERTVYQMLFDYQSLPEGGEGYLRLMHFSLNDRTITIKTYSPSEDSYSSGAFTPQDENIVISLDDLGIAPNEKTLETTSMSANIYRDEVIGTVNNVASGDVVSVEWQKENGHYGWYAEIKDSYGGVKRTPVYYLDVDNTVDNIAKIQGVSRVGNTIKAKLATKEGGEISDNSRMTYKWYRLNNQADENGTLVGESESYKLVSEDKDKFIKLVISYEGKDYETAVSVGSSSSSSSSHSHSSGGSNNSSSNSNTGNANNTTNNNNATSNNNNKTNSIKIQNDNNGISKLVSQDGKIATGWQVIDNKWYLADNEGYVKTGWQQVNNKWYLLKEDGAMITGWQQVNNKWYLLKEDGAMTTGWQQVNNKWYLLKEDGVMTTGWQELNGEWYLLKEDGTMATGWQKINDNWYYLYTNGTMASDTIINGYKINKDGSMN